MRGLLARMFLLFFVPSTLCLKQAHWCQTSGDFVIFQAKVLFCVVFEKSNFLCFCFQALERRVLSAFCEMLWGLLGNQEFLPKHLELHLRHYFGRKSEKNVTLEFQEENNGRWLFLPMFTKWQRSKRTEKTGSGTDFKTTETQQVFLLLQMLWEGLGSWCFLRATALCVDSHCSSQKSYERPKTFWEKSVGSSPRETGLVHFQDLHRLGNWFSLQNSLLILVHVWGPW